MTKGLILFVGDVNDTTAQAALSYDPTAFLIDHSNYQNTFTSAVAYTSLGDLPNDSTAIYQLFDQAKQLVYVPESNIWSDGKSLEVDNVSDSMQGLTEIMLASFFKEKQNVENLDFSKYSPDYYLKLADVRKTNDAQLWISGCSNSHATGVAESERYGQLIANELGKQVSFLTCPGSSIEWQADQIIRSDIQAGDIVIWGLPDESRFTLWTDINEPWHVIATYRTSKKNLLELTGYSHSMIDRLLADPTTIYKAVIHIHKVLNFCKKINATLIIFGIAISDTLSMKLTQVSEFIKYTNKTSNPRWLDLGTDNQHPGPQQHKQFAEICINHLKSLK